MTDDAEPVFDEKGPERTCIVTRAKGDPRHMLRFVVGPGGDVVPDLRARLPGRGAWVTGASSVVATAVKRRTFPRAFRREVVVADALPTQVEALLVAEALAALAIANKAGLVVAGTFKVQDALGAGQVMAVLHASDGSLDGIRKIDALSRRSSSADRPAPPSLQIFASQQMDLALGRSNVIHAALLGGGASAAFLERAARLQRYCGAGLPKRTGREAGPEMISS